MQLGLLDTLGYILGGLWTAWGGRRRIEAAQLRRLHRLVGKARRDSPWFSRRYAGLAPSGELRLADLPVTRKPELMAAFDDWLTIRTLPLARAREHLRDLGNLGVPIDEVALFQTSGTSGEPAIVVLPSAFVAFAFGISLARFERRHWQLLRDIGRLGVRVTVTGGRGHFAGVGFNTLVRRLRPGFATVLDFIEAEQPIGRIVERLNAYPRVSSISTYPSLLSILAKEQEAGRLRIAPVVISTGGETLTPELRARVLRAFPTLSYGILDNYGCTECLAASFHCSHGRKHVNEDWVILEAVDEAMRPVPDGTLSASALLTVLANEVQPFIRYDIGDCLRFHTDACPCGSPFRSFEVEGRDATLIRVGGITLSPLVFDLEHEQARRVQLVQTGERAFELRVELAEGASAAPVFDAVLGSVRRVFRENGLDDVSVVAGEAAPVLTASGKFREVVPLKGSGSGA